MSWWRMVSREITCKKSRVPRTWWWQGVARGWNPRAWWDSHHCGRFFRRRLHRFSAEEVCTSGDVGRSTKGKRCFWCRPYLQQGRPPRRCSLWQRPSDNLSSNRWEEGAPCAGGSRKLDKHNVLDDFQQAAVVSWHVKVLHLLPVRFRGRPGGDAWSFRVEDHLHRW